MELVLYLLAMAVAVFGVRAWWKRLEESAAPSLELTDLSGSSGLTHGENSDTTTVRPPVDPTREPTEEDYRIVVGYQTTKKNIARIRNSPRTAEVILADPWLPMTVLGASGSGKTTSIAVPSLLRWPGSAFVTSIKHDVLRHSWHARSKLGPIFVFDPSESLPPELQHLVAPWSPLAAARTWKGAVDTAKTIIDASSMDKNGSHEFWNNAATDLLTIMMYLTAQRPGANMFDVLEKITDLNRRTQAADGTVITGFSLIMDEVKDMEATLKAELRRLSEKSEGLGGQSEQLNQSIARVQRRLLALRPVRIMIHEQVNTSSAAEQTFAGVAFTCSTALSVYKTALIAGDTAWDDPDLIDVSRMLAERGTIYLVGPPKEQKKYAPLFAAFTQYFFDVAYMTAARQSGEALPIPSLALLDEVANTAPIKDLTQLASSARSLKIQMLLIAQDLSQMQDRWGDKGAQSILSNSGTVAILPRTKDPATLDWAAKVLGEARMETVSETWGTSTSETKGATLPSKQEGGSKSKTKSFEWRPVASPGRIAAMNAREILAIVGDHRVQALQCRFYEDPAVLALQQQGAGLGSWVVADPSIQDWSTGIADPSELDGMFESPFQRPTLPGDS